MSRAASAAPEATAKGSTVRSLLAYLRQEFGDGRVDEILDALPGGLRERVEAAAQAPTTEVPFAVLAELLLTADRGLRAELPDWAERAGAFAIESYGLQLYSGIVRKASPLEFLTQPVSLFRLYYQPGNMEVVEHGAGRAVLRLVGFDQQNGVFCRRQTGGLRETLRLAGGQRASARHVRCIEEGDAFCEWELRWE